MPRIAIVVLSYKQPGLLATCLRSVQEHTDLRLHEVIVVDNASRDGSAEMVAREFPWATVLQNPENRGFAGGVNRGLVHAKADGYVLLNSDAQVQPRWLDLLIESAWSAPDVGLVGAMEVTASGASRWGGPEGAIRDPSRRAVTEEEAVAFACALIRREVIDRIGYLDHGFFMYHEDWDYCHRARAAGFRILYDPRVEVIHVGEASFKTQAQAWRTHVRTVSRLRYQFIHWPTGRLLRSTGRELLMLAYWIKEGQPGPYLRGWRDTVRARKDIRRRRRDLTAYLRP